MEWFTIPEFPRYEYGRSTNVIRNRDTHVVVKIHQDKYGNKVVYLYKDGKQCCRGFYKLVSEIMDAADAVGWW